MLQVQKVSKTWKYFANEKSLWKSVKVDGLIIKDWKVFFRILNEQQTRCLDLTNLTMPQSDEEPTYWINFLLSISELKRLEELHLSKCPSFVTKAIIDSSSEICKNLKFLKLIGCDLSFIKDLDLLPNYDVIYNLKTRTFKIL